MNRYEEHERAEIMAYDLMAIRLLDTPILGMIFHAAGKTLATLHADLERQRALCDSKGKDWSRNHEADNKLASFNGAMKTLQSMCAQYVIDNPELCREPAAIVAGFHLAYGVMRAHNIP